MRPLKKAILIMGAAALLTQCGTNTPSEGSKLGASQIYLGDKNPFEGANFFINSYFVGNLEKSKARAPQYASQIGKMQAQGGTSIWVVTRELVRVIKPFLTEAREQQAKSGKPVVTSFVVYNLPERDCSATASAGELLLDQDGMKKYKNEFIDAIAAEFSKFQDMPIAVVLEPDSLPNIVTNNGVRKCNQKVFDAYREGVAYAIKKLALPNVAIYLDAGHAGWLGWDNNRQGVSRVFKEVLDLAGGTHLIRGFATNVSNYTPLVEPDPSMERRSSPYYSWNPAMDELTYVNLLQQNLEQAGIKGKHFIIDTGRNGNPRARTSWGNWCNVKKATIGHAPAVNPAPGIDAYIWVKPPGESDGSATVGTPSQPQDPSCASADSMPNAPLAGEWFHEHLLELLR